MLKIHHIDKLNDSAGYIICHGKHVQDANKLVYLLFLLDIKHFFEVGRTVTGLTYFLLNNEIMLNDKNKGEVELLYKNNLTKYDKNKFTQRELDILQLILKEWDLPTPANLINFVNFKLITEKNGQISFKNTLEINDNKAYEELKSVIKDREDIMDALASHPSEQPPHLTNKKCKQVKS